MSRTINILGWTGDAPPKGDVIDLALTHDAKGQYHFFLELATPTDWIYLYGLQDGLEGRKWKRSALWNDCSILEPKAK